MAAPRRINLKRHLSPPTGQSRLARLRNACRRAAPLLLGALILAQFDALAATKSSRPSAGDVAEKKSDLGGLRERIEQLKKEVAAGESSRAEAADQLKESERAISDAQRDLRELGEQRLELQNALRELGQQTQSLSGDLTAQQDRLARLLLRQYLAGTPDTLRLLLSGENPNQVARDLHYLGLIAQARATLLRSIEALIARKLDLAEKTRARETALAAVETEQKNRHDRITKQRDARKQLLAGLSTKIAAQRKEIGALKRDEQRLAQLVDRLTRLVASRKAPPKVAAKPTRRGPPRPEAAPESVRETPEAGFAGNFAKLRGSLRLPVAGTLSGRFGGPRDGGGTWKGVFIRAAAGSEAKAVAPGRVVFADWMRGFGNLLILDHGDGYLSIYGYNDGLLRQVGDTVRSGDAIATVGSSGGQPESGLYFEIRHQGQPIDPLAWAKLR